MELKIIDEIIAEPVGGAHRDRDLVLKNVKNLLTNNLNEFNNMSREEVVSHRKNKFLSIGRNRGFISRSKKFRNFSNERKFFRIL